MALGWSSKTLDLDFWANLKQHLTNLHLLLPSGDDEGQSLAALGMLTALQRLEVGTLGPLGCRSRNMAGEKLAWKLPHLRYLHINGLKDGELVLLCPNLAKAHFLMTELLRIEVVDAALAQVSLTCCTRFQFTCTSPEAQLQHLEYLSVGDCSEVGKHLIEYVSLMSRLRAMSYVDFPGGCMPTQFPQSLELVCLWPTDWAMDLPGGLSKLPNLRSFTFTPFCETWVMVKPLAQFLPVQGLQHVQLGAHVFSQDALACLRQTTVAH